MPRVWNTRDKENTLRVGSVRLQHRSPGQGCSQIRNARTSNPATGLGPFYIASSGGFHTPAQVLISSAVIVFANCTWPFAFAFVCEG